MTQDGHKLTFKLLELEGKEGKHKWVAGKGLEGEISLPPPPENAHTGLGKLWFLTPLTLSRSGQHRKEVGFTGGSFKWGDMLQGHERRNSPWKQDTLLQK